MRTIKLYLNLLWLDLQVRTQYRADFLIGMGAALLQHSVTLATLWLIFAKVPVLGGWNASQAAVLYALFSLAMGLVNLAGSGLRELPWMVDQGELDSLLIQPVNPFAQLLPRFNPMSLGDLATGAVVLVLSAGPAGIHWSPVTVLFCLLAIFCGAAVLLGILIAVYSLSFWVHQPGLSGGVEQMTQLAQYPANIYPRWIQVLITWVFPVTFASFYPAAVLTQAQAMPLPMGLLAVPIAAAALGLGAWLWHLGLSKYEGTGA